MMLDRPQPWDHAELDRAESRFRYCERELSRFLEYFDAENPQHLRGHYRLHRDLERAKLDLAHAREHATAANIFREAAE